MGVQVRQTSGHILALFVQLPLGLRLFRFPTAGDASSKAVALGVQVRQTSGNILVTVRLQLPLGLRLSLPLLPMLLEGLAFQLYLLQPGVELFALYSPLRRGLVPLRLPLAALVG